MALYFFLSTALLADLIELQISSLIFTNLAAAYVEDDHDLLETTKQKVGESVKVFFCSV